MNLSPWQFPHIITHSQRLWQSFTHWTGASLLPTVNPRDPLDVAKALFQAPFVLLSHGTEADPILNYGNQTALTLWEYDWSTFTQMPSRLTAEAHERQSRQQQLSEATRSGWIQGYQGIRISGTGQRFLIEDAIIWDVLDATHSLCGQAATFKRWHPLHKTL
ncbi:MEKHLA domain-containing protein [Synechococcales cyanobacterium C]|uniref:MEKHLA domain-containing protein n=2 Tax=Petrachloros TaxID=2918834 RepID=A0A8K2A2F2_9CYAN|nr:MEKHLA domain-containing protein [Petrachloros mirabilis]NCJ08543.1 MEKHLA domain-containing protein [Petrachloros mirabilis ULC683]